MNIIIFICLSGFILVVNSTMIKKECLAGEVHISCSFFEEYTCWAKEDRTKRVKLAPHPLTHCRSGCYCKKGFVREYPGGPCIPTSSCRDQNLQTLLEKLPKKFPMSLSVRSYK